MKIAAKNLTSIYDPYGLLLMSKLKS
jgi:hypothetical protein